ncbi:hypothetical protein AAHC03_04645 [Spirometra sp. Aus1]
MVYLLSPFITPAFRRICLPFVPATPSQLRNVCGLLRHAQCSGRRLGRVLDIGSGDGRVVTSVLTDPRLCVDRAVGVELNRPLVWLSRWRAWRLGLLPSRASFYRADLWKFSLSPYQTVIVFGVDSMVSEPSLSSSFCFSTTLMPPLMHFLLLILAYRQSCDNSLP